MDNGMVKHLNSIVIQMLCTLEKIKYKRKDSLSKLMYAYNCTKHSVTGYSPYFLLFGKNPKLPIDIILSEHQEPANEQPTNNNFIQAWKAGMKEAFKIAEKYFKIPKKPSKYKEKEKHR